jgi:hypothetical protein
MSNVVEFPDLPPVEGYSEAYIEKLHSGAFRDLEGEVCDLERMGQIAQDLIVQCVAREDGLRDLELSTFAVTQLAKIIRDFKDKYYKRWHGELARAS